MKLSERWTPGTLVITTLCAVAIFSSGITQKAVAQGVQGATAGGTDDAKTDRKGKLRKGDGNGERRRSKQGASNGGGAANATGAKPADKKPAKQATPKPKPAQQAAPQGNARSQQLLKTNPFTKKLTPGLPQGTTGFSGTPNVVRPQAKPNLPNKRPVQVVPNKTQQVAPKVVPNKPPQFTQPATTEANTRTGKRKRRNRQSEFRNLNDTRTRRVQEKSAGGGVLIKEPDNRLIVRQGNRLAIQKDETRQLRRLAPNARTTRSASGLTTTVVRRPNGMTIITETDNNGQLVRRYRRDGRGRETMIIDNRRRKSNLGRNLAIGAGIVAGAAILHALVDVPPPRIRVPRDKYIVDYEDASDDDIYEALDAPPVDDFDGYYTLDQVRATRNLRERMRRVDLDDINFETGSWEIDESEDYKLERIARAMRRIIGRNPNEVFMIEGYTDAVGSDVDNMALSDRRAEAVAEVLSEEFDVPFENLTTQGYGEQFLKVETYGPSQANRRVAIRRITPLLAGYREARRPERRWRQYRDYRRN